jgi:N-acetyl-1-D-myo-inositol-2-amino-2-deoxy-alpha-D-glucopyranoside deacetylase
MVTLHAEDPGFRFILVHATDGGQGDIREGFPATRETLGALRMAEDESAWRALGREPDRHDWLGYPDGEVDRVPFDELVDRVAAILAEERPTVVCTFGPDGVFDHPDHITIGAATDAAFARFASDSGTAFRRLIHGAVPQSVFDRWQGKRIEHGLNPFDPTQRYHMRGVPDEEIALWVDTSSVAPRVVAGLMQHKSQHHVMSDFADNPKLWERVVQQEWGVVWWPPRGPDEGRLSDPFEDLP